MRESLRFSIVGFLAFSIVASVTHATAPDSDSPGAVVVTATRIPTPESEIGSSITLITSNDIAGAQEETLPGVLQTVPGLNLVQTGGPGGLTSVFMRGTNPNHTKVLVDGIDVSDPSSAAGTFDFGQFLTQDIERVEVLRGPQSGLYGSDAIGGVINIITQSGSGPTQLTGAMEGGSFDTFNQYGTLSGSDEQFHYTANVEHFHSGATPVTPLNTLAPGESRIDDYYDNLTASTKLGFDVTQDFDLGLVARYTETHYRNTSDDNVYFGYPDPAQSESNTSEYYTRGSAHWISLDGFLEQTLGLAYTRNSTAILTPGFTETQDTGERTKVDWQGTLKLASAQTLVLGAEHARDEISEPLSAAMTINAGYAELQSQFGAGFYSAINVRYDHDDQFGGKVTYRIAPTWQIPNTGTQLKASVGTGFKAPTLSELYQNFPQFFFFGNPNLKPETSTGYDLGVEQTLAGDALRAGVTYFHNHVHDLIDLSADGSSYANIGRATTDGVESFIAYRPMKALTLRLDYTYTETIDDVLNQELLRRPKHKGSLSAAWQATHALSLNATVLSVSSWVDGNRDFSIRRLQAPGYTVVNLAASYDVTRHFIVFGRIDNLFDHHYENPFGFLQPALGAFAGIKVKL
jgi:vitamin B12 transporter